MALDAGTMNAHADKALIFDALVFTGGASGNKMGSVSLLTGANFGEDQYSISYRPCWRLT